MRCRAGGKSKGLARTKVGGRWPGRKAPGSRLREGGDPEKWREGAGGGGPSWSRDEARLGWRLAGARRGWSRALGRRGERAGGPPPREEGASRVPAGAQEGGVGSARVGGGGSGSRPARTHVQDDGGAPARQAWPRTRAGVRSGGVGVVGGQRRPGLAHPGAHPAQQPAQRPALRRRLPEQPVRAGPAQARRPLAHRAAPAAAARKPADPRPARGPPPRDPSPLPPPAPPRPPPSAPRPRPPRGRAGAGGRRGGRSAWTPSHVPRVHRPRPPTPGSRARLQGFNRGGTVLGAGPQPGHGRGCPGGVGSVGVWQRSQGLPGGHPPKVSRCPPPEGSPTLPVAPTQGPERRCPAIPERPLLAAALGTNAHALGLPHYSRGPECPLKPTPSIAQRSNWCPRTPSSPHTPSTPHPSVQRTS